AKRSREAHVSVRRNGTRVKTEQIARRLGRRHSTPLRYNRTLEALSVQDCLHVRQLLPVRDDDGEIELVRELRGDRIERAVESRIPRGADHLTEVLPGHLLQPLR